MTISIESHHIHIYTIDALVHNVYSIRAFALANTCAVFFHFLLPFLSFLFLTYFVCILEIFCFFLFFYSQHLNMMPLSICGICVYILFLEFFSNIYVLSPFILTMFAMRIIYPHPLFYILSFLFSYYVNLYVIICFLLQLLLIFVLRMLNFNTAIQFVLNCGLIVLVRQISIYARLY